LPYPRLRSPEQMCILTIGESEELHIKLNPSAPNGGWPPHMFAAATEYGATHDSEHFISASGHDFCKRTMRNAASRGGGSSNPTGSKVGSSSVQPGNVPDRPLPGFQRQFEFVQGLNSKAERKKTRSWVTTQHYRRKRFEEQKPEHSADAEGKARGRQRSTPSSRSSRSDGDQQPRTEPQAPAKAACMITGTDEAAFLQRLGSGRADPFNSYPVPATRDVHELVDHCAWHATSVKHH
jgi:hypothetical protein